MKNWVFIVCIALLSASCNSIISSQPIGTLSVKKMTDVLVDIQLTEATLKIADDSLLRISDTTELRNRFAEVFKKNDVDPDDFNASLNYYLVHIEELDQIYVEVINRLTALEASLVPKMKPDANGSYTGMTDPGNPWQRIMNKSNQPIEFQYFDSSRYSLSPDDRPGYYGPGRKIIKR